MFSVDYQIMFYDADSAGVLFYGNIFRIMHFTLEKFFTSVSLYGEYFNNPDYAFPVKNAVADFKNPVRPGDIVKIQMSVLGIKNSSFELKYEMINSEGFICAEGRTVHVCVAKKDGQKTKLPENILTILAENQS